MGEGQRLELLEAHEYFPAALKIIKTLNANGYTGVLAGGCVRDSLIGVRPKDLDIATSALPEAVEKSFTKTLAVGKAFGTIVVVEEGRNYEVTTFRSDGPYLDGRRPSSVAFTGIEEDARRRDFTVNALFYEPLKGEVLDYVGGLPDLQTRLLRAVGRAEERFREDRLRMLRAVRFVGQLGFTLDEEALQSIQDQHQALSEVSVERVFNEVRRLLESAYLIQGLNVLRESRLDCVFWPELATLDTEELRRFPAFMNWENAFAAVCWLTRVQDPEPRLRQWKVSRESLRKVAAQLQGLKTLHAENSSRADRARLLGSEVFGETLNLAQALLPEQQIQSWVNEYLEVADRTGEMPAPFLTGEDLRRMGVPPGEQMGRLLKQIFDAQLEGRVRSKDEALAELSRLKP